jgi:hypothetical protein
MAALVTEEAAGTGARLLQIVRGDGWLEAKAPAVLCGRYRQLARLGDAVKAVGFFANGTGPVEIVQGRRSHHRTRHRTGRRL